MDGRGLDRLDALLDGQVQVIVEAAAGSRTKYKYDPEHGVLRLHQVLPPGWAYPRDFGFVPSTLGQDGDPLDVLVFADEACVPGTLVPCRLVGVIEASQQEKGKAAERNDRLIAVAAQSHLYADWKDIGDIPASELKAIEGFYVSFNAQRGKDFKPIGRKGRETAMRLLEEGMHAAAKHGTGSGG
jgi:inorganic pyrophosphatase